MKPDPKVPSTIKENMLVKYAPEKDSSPDQYIDGIIMIVLKHDEDFAIDGTFCRFKDTRLGYVREIVESFDLTEIQVNDLITADEGKHIERKESYLVDVATNTVKGWVKDQVVKEIAAFMNTRGGYVIIGQKDDGAVVGIDPDLEYNNNTKRPEKDNVDDYKTQMEDYIFKKLADKRLEEFVDIIIPKFQVKGKTICIIKIDKSPKIPALLHVGDMQIIKTQTDHFNEKYLSGELAYFKKDVLSGELDLVEENDLSGELALVKDGKDPKPRLVKSDKVPRKWKNTDLKSVIMYVRKNQKTEAADIREKFN